MAFADAMPALLKGQIDLMVGPVGVYAKVEGVEEERLTTDPFAVIVRSGHPLRRRPIDLIARDCGRRLGFAE